MKTILVINDGSAAANHASILALQLAQCAAADLLIANTARLRTPVASRVMAGHRFQQPLPVPAHALIKQLNALNQEISGRQPLITAVSLPEPTAVQIADLAGQKKCWMVVTGTTTTGNGGSALAAFSLQTLLNKLHCPLFLVPENWELKPIERLTYIADLRYCRLSIVRYLSELALPLRASLSVAHLSAKGLPHIEEQYSHRLFAGNIAGLIKYDRLSFNNIRERDLNTAADVIIHGLHNDVLAFVNHRYHFKQLIGEYLSGQQPATLSVPLLLFPY